MMLEQRTICLIPIPFTDLKSQKKRPVLIISNNGYNQKTDDILVMAITSNITEKDYSVLISQKNLEKGNLKRKSIIRIDKIYSISQALVIKTFGKISEEKFDEVIESLNSFIKKT